MSEWGSLSGKRKGLLYFAAKRDEMYGKSDAKEAFEDTNLCATFLAINLVA